MRLIDEQGASIETSLISAYHSLARVANFVLDFLVHFVADIIKTLLDENNLVDIIKLCEDDVLVFESDRVELLQKLDHEVLVLKVVPGVERVLVGARKVRDAKVPSELLQEADEHEMSVNLTLDFTWKLLEKSVVFRLGYSLVVVVLPSVVEVVLDPLFHLDVDVLAFVELLDQSEELRQIVSVVKATANSFRLVQDLDEVAHNVRKDSHAEQKDESRK